MTEYHVGYEKGHDEGYAEGYSASILQVVNSAMGAVLIAREAFVEFGRSWNSEKQNDTLEIAKLNETGYALYITMNIAGSLVISFLNEQDPDDVKGRLEFLRVCKELLDNWGLVERFGWNVPKAS